MFQKTTLLTSIVLLISSSLLHGQNKQGVGNYPFQPGDKLTYSMHYGWFQIGTAELWIDPELNYSMERPQYSVQFNMRASGILSFFLSFRACFDSKIDVETLHPTESFRDLKQGKRIDIRHDFFSYQDSVHIKAYIEDIETTRFHAFYDPKMEIRDALSTFLWIWSQDVAGLETAIDAKIFFGNDLYDFSVEKYKSSTYRYLGEIYDTKVYRLVFPVGEYFPRGKEAFVEASDDERKIPFEFEIGMSIGTFSLKLESRN